MSSSAGPSGASGNRKSKVANPDYEPIEASKDGYASFDSFYPYYLGEHNNPICRRLHLIGTSISGLVLVRVILAYLLQLLPLSESIKEKARLKASAWKYFAGAIAQAYFFAWVGHFWFEKNKPATFKYPIWSFRGDLKLWWEVVTMQRKA